MSTIAREFTKEQLQQIIETDHVQCGEASELARIALASLEAEPVAYMVGTQLLENMTQAIAYKADTALQIKPLYTAPSAPVSVPDLKPVGFLFVSDDGAVAYSPAGCPMKGFNLIGPIYGDVNACRAAMLQSFGNSEQLNSPVIPDCWCRTCRPITLRDMRFVVCPECGNKRCPHANDHRNACTGSNEPGQEGSAYPATPQQEISHALAKGMERYGDVMQKLADSGD